MAKKQTATQAEKIVSESKKKASASKTPAKAAKKSVPKKTSSKKKPAVKTEYENPIPSGVATAIVSFFLFILLLLVSLKPEGALLMVVKSVVLGLIGQAGFYFSIPACFFLFFINTFGRKVSVRMRGVCALTFVFLCGLIYHLLVCSTLQAEGFAVISELYKGGISGRTGGVLCGGAAMLLRWGCGTPLSYFITILAAIFTLLGAMQITIPSLIRAIANRPREDWEEEEEAYIEPAAVVVNHIANKKIEQKRQRRERIAQEAEQSVSVPEKLSTEQKQKNNYKNAKKQPAVDRNNTAASALNQQDFNGSTDAVKQLPGKGAAFMNRVDAEIGAPLSGTSTYIEEDIPNVFEEPVTPISAIPVSSRDIESEFPTHMPELKKNVKISVEPKEEKQPIPKKAGEIGRAHV